MIFRLLFLVLVLSAFGVRVSPAADPVAALDQQLLREDPANLAKAARAQGDPARGALLFYQPVLTCAKCHDHAEHGAALGPESSKTGRDVTPAYLVESILAPSKVIKKGFETVTVLTTRGTTMAGVLAEERPDAVVLRDAAQDGKLVTVPKREIEERNVGAISLMPAGLVNQLGDRRQFLDLACFVLEIAEKGPARARELRPAAALVNPAAVPDYEKDIDHAGLIRALDGQSFKRGEAIYQRVCQNCHGTKDQPGSLPTSLPFATGKFKNGSDPFRMYQTLTHGFGMMTAQTWMVPKQKYDVIQYIREAYLKPHNSGQYVRVDDKYLGALPKGAGRGPEPSNVEPWVAMDYGPSLSATYEVGHDGSNFAYKGIAVRLDPGPGGVSRGRAWAVYDHDSMRLAGAWTGEGFIDWTCVHFDGQHQVHPHVVGQVRIANPDGPGWADPETGRFDDPRIRGRDGKHYGPFPLRWMRYRGLYHFGGQVVLSYTVGNTAVLELPGLAATKPEPVLTRTFNIGPRDRDMFLQVDHQNPGKASCRLRKIDGDPLRSAVLFGSGQPGLAAGLLSAPASTEWLSERDGNLRLKIPRGPEPLKFTLWLAPAGQESQARAEVAALPSNGWDMDLSRLSHGGPPQWGLALQTPVALGSTDGPFAADVLQHPDKNPWLCQMRLTGFDFFADGKRAAVCTWDGDVWTVTGLDHPEKGLTWRRFAAGLFQPLGLKILNDTVYVGCRDQIAILRDLDGDGEADFYECFNSDHQVTDHFHEFAMGLQTDKESNFYYAKGGRHALTAVVPQHGTLLRVSKDGSRTDILATGFRAANGVCLNPDGTFFLTDQEGHWTPKNRINWVRPGRFYGYMWGYHDVTDPSDSAMEQPVCWITNRFDRSPSELLYVDSPKWGPLNGGLLNLSYGYGKVYIVPHETVHGQMQGGMSPLPIPEFPTGVMRGRFHPDGSLYLCGMFAWAGNRAQPGGFYRVRATGKAAYVPVALHARKGRIEITFSDQLDPAAAADVGRYAVRIWSLKRTANYGSDHIDEHPLRVAGAQLAADRRTVTLVIPEIGATWCMEIKYGLKGAEGKSFDGLIHNTIHQLGD